MTIRTTEMELTTWISNQINKILESRGYPFSESTVEPSLKGEKSRFPDIVIWNNRKAKDAFAFIELKPPGKKEDLNRIPEVANRLDVKYAITWDFLQAFLFYCNKTIESKKTYPTYTLSQLEEWLYTDKQIKIKKYLEYFLDDLKELYDKGHLHKFPPDKYFFIKLLQDATNTLYDYFVLHLEEKLYDRDFKKAIDKFLYEQGIPDLPTPEIQELLTRQWVYGLVTRILFYLTIRKHYPELPDIVKEVHEARSLNKLINNAFKKARKVDWQAVFEAENKIDKIGIPKNCDSTVKELLKRLDEYNFNQLKEDVIGEILEYLIPDNVKRKLGQYFTREDLVDLIVGFVVQTPKGFYSDPTCGSGTFLNRIYSRIKFLSNYSITHTDLLSQIWGIDIAKFPSELATINLFKQDISNYRNFPKIKVIDFFDVSPGQEFEFPPAKAGQDSFDKIKVKLPSFSGMVGNFPFIRQEQIEKKIKGNKLKITKMIAQDWFREYPDIFKTKKITNSEFEKVQQGDKKEYYKYLDGLFKNKGIDLKLSGQADIYAYLFLHSAKFLLKDGRLGFITSNSYLDVRYGYELKKFFLNHFKIVAVVVSWAEPWFDFASVNTVFTILERCTNKDERENHFVKFVKLNKKLVDLIPFRDLELEESERWNHIDRLIKKIEYCKTTSTKKEIQTYEDEDFSIRLVKQTFLNNELNTFKEHAKWGKYLRAPNVYFEIIGNAKNNLVPLGEMTEIRFGIKTGINDFFYLEPTGEKAKKKNYVNVKNNRGWVSDIEKRFLKTVIKSPKESESIIINHKKLKWKLFMCNYSKEDLKKMGYRGALNYIEWGEKQKTSQGVKWTKVPSVKNRAFWWYLTPLGKPSFLINRFIDKRFYFTNLPKDTVVADTFFVGYVSNKDTEITLAFLNSTIYGLFVEVNGRVNLGDGVLTFYGPDIESTNIIIPDKINNKDKKQILKQFGKLQKRTVREINEEIKLKDRNDLDYAILKAIGLKPELFLKDLYKSLPLLVNERLSLPKMRKKITKNRIDLSIDDIKKQVEEEILSGGLRNFPESFVTKTGKMRMKEIPISGLPMKIGHHFFGKYEIIDEIGKKIYEAESLETANYIICSYKQNEYIIEIPKSRIEITKAINKYEKYIITTFEQLVRRAFSATHDHDMADRIALDILKENGYSGYFELQ